MAETPRQILRLTATMCNIDAQRVGYFCALATRRGAQRTGLFWKGDHSIIHRPLVRNVVLVTGLSRGLYSLGGAGQQYTGLGQEEERATVPSGQHVSNDIYILDLIAFHVCPHPATGARHFQHS